MIERRRRAKHCKSRKKFELSILVTTVTNRKALRRKNSIKIPEFHSIHEP